MERYHGGDTGVIYSISSHLTAPKEHAVFLRHCEVAIACQLPDATISYASMGKTPCRFRYLALQYLLFCKEFYGLELSPQPGGDFFVGGAVHIDSTEV